MITRRRLLASGGGVLATAVAILPFAHDDATLDVEIDVDEIGWTAVDEDTHSIEVDALELAVTVRESESVDPVVFCWGRYNWMMQAWSIADGPESIAPGHQSRLHVEAPSSEARLYPDQPAQVTVVDAGTERRAKKTFRPMTEEHGRS